HHCGLPLVAGSPQRTRLRLAGLRPLRALGFAGEPRPDLWLPPDAIEPVRHRVACFRALLRLRSALLDQHTHGPRGHVPVRLLEQAPAETRLEHLLAAGTHALALELSAGG